MYRAGLIKKIYSHFTHNLQSFWSLSAYRWTSVLLLNETVLYIGNTTGMAYGRYKEQDSAV